VRPIGFSTGALAFSDFQAGLQILRANRIDTVELSALRENELTPLVNTLDSLDLSSFKYISFHAPSKYEKLREAEVIDTLRKVAIRKWPIILHPDVIQDFSAWNSFGQLLLIENMDKRNVCGRTVTELADIFVKLPQAGLCFDVGHCRQVDPTMSESRLILREFKSRLKQLHMSEVNSRSTHDAITEAAIGAFEKISYLIPENIPVILESTVQGTEVEAEIGHARSALPLPKTNSAQMKEPEFHGRGSRPKHALYF